MPNSIIKSKHELCHPERSGDAIFLTFVLLYLLIVIPVMKTLLITTIVLVCAIFEVSAQRRPILKGHERYHSKADVKPLKRSKYNPHKKYDEMPPRDARLKTMYDGAKLIKANDIKYHLNKGIWFKKNSFHEFAVVAAPIGAKIRKLPDGYETAKIDSVTYYYYFGTFYAVDEFMSSYEVVYPPVNFEVSALPRGYETVSVDGEEHYRLDNIFYKPIKEDKKVRYKVVKVE